jgi:two-component sensor histidine kinase
LGLDYLIPCGLIINELVSNCFKHAFDVADNGNVLVHASVVNNDCVITISDNGKGFKKGFVFEDSKSLGLQLVSALVSQINGTIVFDSKKGNTSVMFKFKFL